MSRKFSDMALLLATLAGSARDKGKELRFTRDSECGIQTRSVAYLYPYELG
jgi:hypothetical protein